MRKQATLGDYITRMFNKDLETRDRLKLAEAVDNLPPGEAEALAQELAGGEKKNPPKKCEGEECKDDEKKEASFEFDPNTPEFLQKVAEADGLGRWIAHAQVEGLMKQADFFGKSVEERAQGMSPNMADREIQSRTGTTRKTLLGGLGGATLGGLGGVLLGSGVGDSEAGMMAGGAVGALAGGLGGAALGRHRARSNQNLAEAIQTGNYDKLRTSQIPLAELQEGRYRPSLVPSAAIMGGLGALGGGLLGGSLGEAVGHPDIGALIGAAGGGVGGASLGGRRARRLHAYERAVGMAAQRQGAPEQQKEAFTPGIVSDLGMLGIPSLVGYGVGSSAGRAEAASGEARPRWGLRSALALGFVPGATGYQLGHRAGYDKVKEEMARRAASQTQTPAASPPTVAAQPGPEEPAKVGSARVADYAGRSIEDRVSNPGVFDHVMGALTHPKLAPVIGGVAGATTGLVAGDMLGNSLAEKALYGLPLAAVGGSLGASLGGRSARARNAAGARRYLQETGETPKVGSAIPLEVYYRMLGKE